MKLEEVTMNVEILNEVGKGRGPFQMITLIRLAEREMTVPLTVYTHYTHMTSVV
jgi:hypothetical protein